MPTLLTDETVSSLRTPVRDSNKVRPEDVAVHDWYRFVLSFPPHLVRDYIEQFGLDIPHTVLDPFCGTGTTLVECKKLNVASIGVERNPMAFFASQVKVDWNVDPERLLDHARQIARLALQKLEADGVDDTSDLPLFRTSRKAVTLRTLPADAWKLLLKDSISPLPLHKTLVLLEALEEHEDAEFLRYERLALARAIVFNISNLHFGPEVGIGPAKGL